MDISQLRKGLRVRFVHPDSGYGDDQEHARANLVEGEIYTVKAYRVGGWDSSITLEEVAARPFNTVHFEVA